MTHGVALLFVPVLIAGFGSCEPNVPRQHEVREVPVRSVTMPDAPRSGDTLLILMTCSIPTPCWEYERTDISRVDSLITIRVFARYDGQPCIQIPGTLSATARVTVPRAGTYRFRYLHPDRTMFERVVNVR